ncbi:hypothetical protein Tco_0405798 [Tanacetum coccineum]
MWILGTNFIFAFPRKLWSSVRVPSYFDYKDTTLLQFFDFLVYDFYWFFHKIKFVIELKFFHWNNEGFIDRHFFKLETWKVLWTLLSSSESSSLYATGLILSRILNGPMYRGLIIPRFPDRDGTFSEEDPTSACGWYELGKSFGNGSQFPDDG